MENYKEVILLEKKSNKAFHDIIDNLRQLVMGNTLCGFDNINSYEIIVDNCGRDNEKSNIRKRAITVVF